MVNKLLERIRNEEGDTGELIEQIREVFDLFDNELKDSNRDELINIIKGHLDPEMSQLILGDLIDDFVESEHQFIDRLDEKRTEDAEILCEYLCCHLDDTYGWELYFEKFSSRVDAKRTQEMKNMLERNFTMEQLKNTFPDIYGD